MDVTKKGDACRRLVRSRVTRREFARASGVMAAAAAGVCAAAAMPAGAQEASQAKDSASGTLSLADIPAPAPDPEDMFGVDLNINMTTIDSYLGIEGVAYRDMRMVFDPADWASMDADPDLTTTIEGFEVVPYPYIATLEPIPVDNAYEGDCLFTLEWDNLDDLNIASVTPNYRESQTILEELFPRDQVIFLMCGGAGYAYMTKKLLTYLGWDASKIYNTGGNWYYEGKRSVTLIERGEASDGSDDVFALWRANIPTIDFSLLHPIA
jgi:hypothetical protein